MSEIKKDLLKIYPESIYTANGIEMIADSETYVINEDHTIADALRYLVTCANGDKSEIATILELLDEDA